MKENEEGSKDRKAIISIAHRVQARCNGAAAIAQAMVAANQDRPEAVTWRDQVEEQIWRQVWRLGLTTEQFFGLISRKLGKRLESVSTLSERDLGNVFDITLKLDGRWRKQNNIQPDAEERAEKKRPTAS